MRILAAILFFVCSAANAQFVTGQILTAAQLNAAFANVLSTSGGTLTGPLTVQGNTTVANLTVNGTFTVPGGFSPSSLAPQAANSLVGNASGATQAPGVVAVPSCSTSTSALQWTSGTGFNCYANTATTTGTLAQFAATTSAQLAGVISDKTGTGSAVFGANPTITGATISGGAGSFTTLAASSTVSGAGFTSLLSPYAPLASPAFTGTATFAARPTFNSNTPYDTGNLTIANYATLASPTFTGTLTAAATSVTTLGASGNDALLYTNTSGQSFTSAVAATVTTWTKTFDRVNANFNASTGIFTAPVTGFYHVSGQLVFSSGAGTVAASSSALITVNAVAVVTAEFFQDAASTTPASVPFNCVVSMTAGQTLTIQGFQNNGGTRTLSTSAGLNFISIHRVP